MEQREGPQPNGEFWCKCLICLKKNLGSVKKVSSSTFYLHNPKWKTQQRAAAQAVVDPSPRPTKRFRHTTKGTSQPSKKGPVAPATPISQPEIRTFDGLQEQDHLRFVSPSLFENVSFCH